MLANEDSADEILEDLEGMVSAVLALRGSWGVERLVRAPTHEASEVRIGGQMTVLLANDSG